MVSGLTASTATTSPVMRMRIAKICRLIGGHLMMMRMRRMRLVAVMQVELSGCGRRWWRRTLSVMPRQSVDGVMRMRRRRAVTNWHSASGAHSANYARMMWMVRMMSRREHGETVVQRNHFVAFT